MSGLQCYGETIFLNGLSREELQQVSRITGFPSSCAPKATLGKLSIRSQNGYYSLTGSGQADIDSQPLELLAQILKIRTILKVALAKPELLFLSGDVVRVSESSTVLIAGPSLSGKTRLAQALIARGASPWSSSMAVLNSKGELLPFPSADLPHNGLPATLIATITFEHQAAWEPETLTPGQAVLKLTPAVVTPSEFQPQAFAWLGQLAAKSKFRYGGFRGDCATVVDRIYQDLNP